ncbi:phosphopantetheine-binding protein [Streptomyces sp. BE147]|uniref:acyl carrier protein n=1 Tax=Streptomyces sp. BE147 TaxID=3002524 RepID=UPI002E75F844|nr:phosphopantetheine-binding protein [Streptomyces sp. BE147]MEE1737871.1 phosphopantetheine-binding protein [Streptomyces sp. BE147]
MKYSEIASIVSALLVSILHVTPEEIEPTSNLQQDLEADSLDFAELSVRLAQRDIKVSKDQVKGADTVADLIRLAVDGDSGGGV